MDSWCPFAERRPSPYFTAGRYHQPIKAVVLHIIEGSLDSAISEFSRSKRHVSAHFGIGKDGRIVQFVGIADTAWANGLTHSHLHGGWIDPEGSVVEPTWRGLTKPINPNFTTISIEHEGGPNDSWTQAMFDANNRVLQWIASQTGLIYVPHLTLIGHYEISPKDRPNCPGPKVDWERIASTALNAPTPAYRTFQIVNPCSNDPKTNFAAVRHGPGEEFPIVLGGSGRLMPGASIMVDHEQDGWLHLANGLGFVSKSLVTHAEKTTLALAEK